MSTVLDPKISEFSTAESASEYDQWFRTKVAASLANADNPSTPRYSSDEVIRKTYATIEQAKTRNAARRLA